MSSSSYGKTPAVEVTIERRSSSSYQMSTEASSMSYEASSSSRKGSRSGSRSGSRVGSRGHSRPTSPSPFDQQTTDEESELRRILEDSRGRRTKFNH